MEKKIKISLKNGTEKFLADLTQADLSNVKLTEKDGESNLTMKTEVIKEDANFQTERRLYKWTTMPTLVMYDLSVPKSLEIWLKNTTKEAIFEYGIGNWKIEQDKVNNGVSNGISKEDKATAKATSKLPQEGKAEVEAILKKYGIKKDFEEMKKDAVKRGFGK